MEVFEKHPHAIFTRTPRPFNLRILPPHSLCPRNPACQIRQGNRRDIPAEVGLDATPSIAKNEALVPPSNLTCGEAPHPSRRLASPPPHTCAPNASHHAPWVVTPRATEHHTVTLSSPTTRHTTRHGKGHRKPRRVTPRATVKDTASHDASHQPLLVAKPVDNLWITCGKPLGTRGYKEEVVDKSTSYPQVIHRLSTGYPQVNT